MQFFGNAIEEQEMAEGTKKHRGPQNLLDLLPEVFTREEMHLTRGMWAAMVAEGYKENTKILTRAHVRTIVQFLGEP